MFVSKPRLCLNMIVKNEIHNLDRCLRSVVKNISCWVICDTGSTDGTTEFIETFFLDRHIPGELHRTSFFSFEQARNEALEKTRSADLVFDYILLVDADMEFVVHDSGPLQTLTAAAYQIRQIGSASYWNTRIIGRSTPAFYRGVTHEYLEITGGDVANLHGVEFNDYMSGANRTGKAERDAMLLREGIAEEKDPELVARYTFYLANSLNDAGDYTGALKLYADFLSLGSWCEELFLSHLYMARIKEFLNYDQEEVLDTYEKASYICPSRLEALHDAARYCRERELFAQGYAIVKRGLDKQLPENALFREDWIYDYGLLDEYAVNAYWSGHFRECAQACLMLLKTKALPAEDRERVAENARFALAKLTAGSSV